MSAFGTKRTSACALRVSAFDPKRTSKVQDGFIAAGNYDSGTLAPSGIGQCRCLSNNPINRILSLCGGSRNTRGHMKSKLLAITTAVAFYFAYWATPATAATLTFAVNLNGPSESPPNSSPGTGAATVTFDTIAFTMNVNVTFQDLLSTFMPPAGGTLPTGVTVAHIHCCTTIPNSGIAGVATTLPTFPGFPSGINVHSGTYEMTFDMLLATSYNPAFIAANGGTTSSAFAALLTGALEGREYLNIHSNAFPSGEIRGFLNETPLPAALPLFATGLGALGLIGWGGSGRLQRSLDRSKISDRISERPPRGGLSVSFHHFAHVRYWHKADIPGCTAHVRFGGKADISPIS